MSTIPVSSPVTLRPVREAEYEVAELVSQPPADRAPRPRFRPDPALMALVFVATAATHLINITGFPALADDEGTYVAQAQAARWGQLAHYTYWYDHPPLGWIQLGMLDWIPQHAFPWMQPVAASRTIAALAASISATLAYVLCRRLGCGRTAATAAGLLLAGSPLAVTMQRQVYLDVFAGAWLIGSLVLACDPRRRLWMQVASGLSFGVAVLTKETVAVLAPAVLWALWQHSAPRLRAFSLAGWLAPATLLISFYPLMALLRGELLPGPGHVSLVSGVVFQLVSRQGSGALWHPGSDSRQILDGWLFFDPWLLVGGFASLPILMLIRRLRPLGAAVGIFALVGARPGGYLPAMYVITALPFLSPSIAAGAEALWRAATSWRLARPLRRAGGLVMTLATAACIVQAAPKWEGGLEGAFTSRTNTNRAAGERWMAANVPAGCVVLTDDVTWVRLVQEKVVRRTDDIWFYKLDTDPAVRAIFPGGWQDVDYVFSTDQLRLAVSSDPALVQSAGALKHSTVVARFGGGGDAVEIRRVDPTQTAGGKT